MVFVVGVNNLAQASARNGIFFLTDRLRASVTQPNCNGLRCRPVVQNSFDLNV
jgi:hypothetical protein